MFKFEEEKLECRKKTLKRILFQRKIKEEVRFFFYELDTDFKSMSVCEREDRLVVEIHLKKYS